MAKSKHYKNSRDGNHRKERKGEKRARVNDQDATRQYCKTIIPRVVVSVVLLFGIYVSWTSRNSFGPQWQEDSGIKTSLDDWSDGMARSAAAAASAATPSGTPHQHKQQPQQGGGSAGEDEGAGLGPKLDRDELFKEATQAVKEHLMQQDPSLSEEEAFEQAKVFFKDAQLVQQDAAPINQGERAGIQFSEL